MEQITELKELIGKKVENIKQQESFFTVHNKIKISFTDGTFVIIEGSISDEKHN